MVPPVPILLEVLAHIPTDFFHCLHCERFVDAVGIGAKVRREGRSSYPPHMLEDAERLAAWLLDVGGRHGERLRVRVVDVQSPEGLWKSVRHCVREYPAFIVNHRTTVTGWDREALERLLVNAAEASDPA
jgi:hypothetical protein